MKISKIIFIIAIAITACKPNKGNHPIDDNFVALYKNSFLGSESLSFEEVVIRAGIVDRWNTEDLESKLINADGDVGLSTFTFRVQSIPRIVDYDISMIKGDSLDFNYCRDKKVFSIGLSQGEDYRSCRLVDGIYVDNKVTPRANQ